MITIAPTATRPSGLIPRNPPESAAAAPSWPRMINGWSTRITCADVRGGADPAAQARINWAVEPQDTAYAPPGRFLTANRPVRSVFTRAIKLEPRCTRTVRPARPRPRPSTTRPTNVPWEPSTTSDIIDFFTGGVVAAISPWGNSIPTQAKAKAIRRINIGVTTLGVSWIKLERTRIHLNSVTRLTRSRTTDMDGPRCVSFPY